MAPYAFPAPASGSPKAAQSARSRTWAAVALGAALAPQGTMVKIALAVMALTTACAVGAAVALSGRESAGALVQLGAAASTALAWGAGILVAVPASLQALHNDRKNGIRALLLARGASAGDYARGRVLGLGLVLLAVVGGGTLVSGGAAFLLASGNGAGAAGHAFEGLVASLLYAAAFATVVSPMSLAALGARSRGGGYIRFLLLLLVPELIEPWTSELVPAGWGELLSVPSALGALRASLPPETFDPGRLARAAFVLAAVAALSFAVVLAEVTALDRAANRDDDPEVRA